MTATGAPLIEVRRLRKVFTNGAVESHALNDIDLSIREGEFVAICGASGSGKSTLLNILGCLDRQSSGSYCLAGRDISHCSREDLARLRRETFGFVFQRYQLISGMTALENVEVPAIYAGVPRDVRRRRAAELLARVGLAGELSKLPAQLSGGQQQRVAIARALVNGASILLADEPTGALDSHSGAELMSVLKELAASGRTIVLITHDPNVAAHADRTVEIADGKVVSQVARATASSAIAKKPSTQPGATGGNIDGASAGSAGEPMWRWSAFADATRSALAALKASPVRTSLTLLGIVIGVASVVALQGIGRGAEADLLERLSAVGTNWLLVTDERESRISYVPITVADAVAISTLPNVAASSPGKLSEGAVSSGPREIKTWIVGATRAFRRVHRWDAHRGAFFSEDDERYGAPVTLLGKVVADKLFPGIADPSGRVVLINRVPFTVVGVLEEKGFTPYGESYDDRVLVPVNAMTYRINGERDLQQIIVEIVDMEKLAETREAVRNLMVERHGKQDFDLYDTAKAHRKASEERASMNLLLVAIGSISLLVGGIGIMNMMLTSVRERTREIGIRTAVGATNGDILRQFLIEAMTLSGTGGIAGLAIGLGIGAGAALLFGMTVIFSVTAAVLAFLTAVALGVVFGFMPAIHAARLDPVAALASE